MARLVPSDVCDAISRMFPPVASGENLKLSVGDAQKIAAILGLVDQIPGETLTVSREDFANLIAAREVLRTAVSMWRTQGSGAPDVKKIPGFSTFSPLTLIYNALNKCPDEVPAGTSPKFAFLEESDFRETLIRDDNAVTQAVSNAEFKAATVIGGSVVEALLLWGIQKYEETDRKKAMEAAGGRPPNNILRWDLSHFVSVARALTLIREPTQQQCDVLRGYRNLIHPGATERVGRECNRGTAHAAVAAIEAVSTDLAKQFA